MPRAHLPPDCCKQVLITLFALLVVVATAEPAESPTSCQVQLQIPHTNGYVTGLIAPGAASPQLIPTSVWKRLEAKGASTLPIEPSQLLFYQRQLEVAPDLRCSSTGMPRGLSLTVCDTKPSFKQHYSRSNQLLQHRSNKRRSREGKLRLRAAIATRLLPLGTQPKWQDQLNFLFNLSLAAVMAKHLLPWEADPDLQLLGGVLGLQMMRETVQVLSHIGAQSPMSRLKASRLSRQKHITGMVISQSW